MKPVSPTRSTSGVAAFCARGRAGATAVRITSDEARAARRRDVIPRFYGYALNGEKLDAGDGRDRVDSGRFGPYGTRRGPAAADPAGRWRVRVRARGPDQARR